MLSSAILLALVAAAPQSGSAPHLATGRVGPLSYGIYDFENGFRALPSSGRHSGPDTLFNSTPCTAYYFGYLPRPAGGQEWVDEFGLAPRGVSGLEEVNGFAWQYCAFPVPTGYFDAVLAIYADTVPGSGPGIWVPQSPSLPACSYLLHNLPGGACWQTNVDLSHGMECALAQTGPPGTAFRGWSVTPRGSFIGGPILATQGCHGYGTVDSFEWRDWPGVFAGTQYTHMGTPNFGGHRYKRADFLCAVQASPEDVRSCHGTAALDVLELSAGSNPEPGLTVILSVEAAPSSPESYALLIGRGACAPVPMTSLHGAWTRQSGRPLLCVHPYAAMGPSFAIALPIPPGAPPDALVSAQLLQFDGPLAPDAVERASNGLEFHL